MPSKWDSGIIVWDTSDTMLVLKEGKSGVYIVDPNQKGRPVVHMCGPIRFAEHYITPSGKRRSALPRAAVGAAVGGFAGALWLGLKSSPAMECTMRIKEMDGTTHMLRTRNEHDAIKMEKRIQKHIDGKVGAAPEPPVGYTPEG